MIVTAVKITKAETDELCRNFCASKNYLESILKRSEDSRDQSVAGLYALLFLLRHEGVDPTGLIIEREKRGKPYFSNSAYSFNIAHSGDFAVCALSNSPVGIDIEQIRQKKHIELLAKRFFSRSECDKINNVGDNVSSFYEVWTNKESMLKRSGRGIDTNLKSADTTTVKFSVFELHNDCDDYVVSVCGEETVVPVGGTLWIPKRK